MKLIADCGSTKIEWCVVSGGEVIKRIFTTGINAVMLTEEEIATQLRDELVQQLGAMPVKSVYFYGAGCLSDDICGNVSRAISKNVPHAQTIEVHTDLLAAARALCGHNPGIACILGTGSNSCYYDGEKICDNVSPLGYILGDEGSGAVLGRQLLGDVLKNQLPTPLCDRFLKEYNLDRLTIIRRVYKEPQANRFLASVTPFLLKNIEEPSIRSIVLRSFKSFFERNVMQYEYSRTLNVNFIGSIAYYYQELLAEAARSCGCRIGKVVKSPMDGLVMYHS